MTISLPKPLLDKIDEHAAKDGRTRSNWVVQELRKRIAILEAGEGAHGQTADPAGKRPVSSTTQFPGRVVPDAHTTNRIRASHAALNPDAPVEIQPVIPAREKSAPQKKASASIVRRKGMEREHHKGDK